MIHLSMRKKYPGFTLVEMLVVMGILIVLLSVTVLVARFAMQRAEDAKHKEAARNLYAILLEFKNDNGEFPAVGDCYGCIQDEFFPTALGYTGPDELHYLEPYIDGSKGFDGGSDTTYYYDVDNQSKQFVIVCVALGGVDDEGQRGFFCTGNGMGYLPQLPDVPTINVDDVGPVERLDPYAMSVLSLDDTDWLPENGGFWISD